jgi:UDP-2-acetamido-2,6-beta-L-arabino-hexul-4-ose reductase
VRILITGANGFIGKNLVVKLGEIEGFEVVRFTRENEVDELPALVGCADAIVHLAGENRPSDEAAFELVNAGLTRLLCDAIRASRRAVPLIFASSTQAELDNAYGISKRHGEDEIARLCGSTENPARLFRLPNVFGKWCRPNYNSVVATFCHNIANGLPLTINDPAAPMRLIYIDDLITEIAATLRSPMVGLDWCTVSPVFETTVGSLAKQLESFAESRNSLVSERVGTGLTRALYATYVSYLPTSCFSYSVQAHRDARGVFVEMLKTPDCGQFSFFTAYPGITRGGHYHHSKTEKFMVIKGSAHFGFRNILNEDYFELETSGANPVIVETIPGWSHNITNIGDDEMVVMLWANEIFDRHKPDTIARSV